MNRRNAEFLAEVFRLTAGVPVTRETLRAKRTVSISRARAFEDTWDKPCGYQDAACERAEMAASDYMQHICAYLLQRYERFPTMIREMLEDVGGVL